MSLCVKGDSCSGEFLENIWTQALEVSLWRWGGTARLPHSPSTEGLAASVWGAPCATLQPCGVLSKSLPRAGTVAGRAVRKRGPGPAVPRANEYAWGPPPPRPHGPRGTALRLWPAKAAGPAAKIVRRGSCTCLFWNRTGLSEFTKPGRQCRLQPSSGPAISHSLRAAPVHYERCPLRSCPPPVPFQAAGTLAVLLALWRRRPLQSPGPHPVTDPTPEVGGQGTKGFPIAHPLSLLWSRLECPLSLSVSFSPFSFLSPGSYSRLWLSPSPYPLMRGAISRLLERLL